MRRLILALVVVLALGIPFGVSQSQASATVTPSGQDPGMNHPCMTTIDGWSSNWFADWTNCQWGGKPWLVSEMENGQGTQGTSCADRPPFQDLAWNSSGGAAVEATQGSAGAYNIVLQQNGHVEGTPVSCSGPWDNYPVYSWIGYLDHNPNANDPSCPSCFGDFSQPGTPDSGPLPAPQNLTQSFSVNYSSTDTGSQSDQGVAVFAGLWAGCYNYVELTFSDNNNAFAPSGNISLVRHTNSWPVLSGDSCFNDVQVDGSHLLNRGLGFVTQGTNTNVVINWGNIIAYLQGLTGCPTGTNPAACIVATGAVLPAYDGGQVTVIAGVGDQTVEPAGTWTTGNFGPIATEYLARMKFDSNVAQVGYGSL
jgi:hypothetical protein